MHKEYNTKAPEHKEYYSTVFLTVFHIFVPFDVLKDIRCFLHKVPKTSQIVEVVRIMCQTHRKCSMFLAESAKNLENSKKSKNIKKNQHNPTIQKIPKTSKKLKIKNPKQFAKFPKFQKFQHNQQF